MNIEEHPMTDDTEERLAALRTKAEEKANAKHEFAKAKTELFYASQTNIPGYTALVLGKLLFYVEAWRSFLEADISIYKPFAANSRLLPVRMMAERLSDRIDHFCRTHEELHRDKIIYRVLAQEARSRRG
jgi:hypothetical protein